MDKVDLTENQRLYLQQIFNHLRETNQWLTFSKLDQWFTYHHPDLDIEEIWRSLPPGLTNYMDLNQPDSQATLTIPAIYLLENTRDALSIFLTIIKRCVDTYMHFPANDTTISSEGFLQERLLAWDIAVRQGGLLLKVEPHIWSSFTGPDESGCWSCTLDRKVKRFRNITTIEEYLAKRDILPSQAITPAGIAGMSNGSGLYTGIPAAAMKKRISDEVMNAITDPKIKQFCTELNNMPDENVFALTQGTGEALKWTLWYRAQQVGTSMTANSMGLDRLLNEAISHPYYSGNATTRFLRDFRNNFLKTSYDMVRHDPVYIPNDSAVDPAIDALAHILKETFPI